MFMKTTRTGDWTSALPVKAERVLVTRTARPFAVEPVLSSLRRFYPEADMALVAQPGFDPGDWESRYGVTEIITYEGDPGEKLASKVRRRFDLLVVVYNNEFAVDYEKWDAWAATVDVPRAVGYHYAGYIKILSRGKVRLDAALRMLDGVHDVMMVILFLAAVPLWPLWAVFARYLRGGAKKLLGAYTTYD